MTILGRLLYAALAMLPPGRAFSRMLSTNTAAVLEGLMAEFARVYEFAFWFYDCMHPQNVDEQLLAEWEDALGLHAGEDTFEARRAAVIERVQRQRDYTLGAYETVVEAYGDGAEIVDMRRAPPFIAGAGTAGASLTNDGWANVVELDIWMISIPLSLASKVASMPRAHGLVQLFAVRPPA